MSTAKMVADSTQSDLPEKSATRKRKKVVQKKKVKRKKENERKGKKKILEEDFEENDLDLENDVKPIGFYVKTRDKLIEQMFSCVKGGSLQRALPDVLKDLPFVDLKRRCLEQLEVMSKKRIRRIIAGDDPATISSSGTEDETTDEELEPEDSVIEYAGVEAQVADSTSLYTQGLGDSDRELDDHEEGSLGHSSHSATPSDDEPMYPEQDEDQISECMYVEQDTKVDGETDMEGEDVENTAEVVKNTPFIEEEAEEGEVIDDCVVEEDGHVLEKQITKKENKEYEAKDDTDELEDTPSKVMGEISRDEMTTEKINISDKDEGEICENEEEYEKDHSKANDNTEKKLAEEELAEHTSDGCEVSNSNSDNEQSNKKDTLIVGDDNDDDETPDADVSISDTVVSEIKEKKGGRVVVPPSIAPVLTRNQMELLELEMRARAIKAMLKTAK